MATISRERYWFRSGIWTKIPNALTLSRYLLGLAVYVLLVIGSNLPWSTTAALVIIVLGELTDLGNGKLARFLGIADPKGVGGVIDTLADHFFHANIAVALVYNGALPSYYLPIVLFVDLGLSNSTRMVLSAKGASFASALWLQKAKTFAQGLLYIATVGQLAALSDWGMRLAWYGSVTHACLVLTVLAITLVSGFRFLYVYWPHLAALPTARPIHS